jgi:hypothetical protein
MSRAAAGIVLSSMVALTGCGGGAKGASSSAPVSSAPAAPATTGSAKPAPAARQRSTSGPGTQTTTPQPPAPTARRGVPDSSPEAAQAVRVPARFALSGGRLRPGTIAVPAFIAIELTVTSREGGERTVVLATRPQRRLQVPGGGRATLTLKGVPRGSYRLSVVGGRSGTLEVGSEPGP